MTSLPLTTENYRKINNSAKQYFENQKTGNLSFYNEQQKLFKPIIDTTHDATKRLEDKLNNDQLNIANALIPFTRELQRKNDQREMFQSLPYYNSEIIEQKTSTPKKKVKIDIDGEFNETDFQNLKDLKLPLPSEVFDSGEIDQQLAEVNVQKRKVGQYLGKASKKSEEEQMQYESQKITLQKYKDRLLQLKASKKIPRVDGTGLSKNKKLVKEKRGRGRPKTKPDVMLYSHPDELVQKLYEYYATKQAGNTGVDNYIVSILDELLEKKFITKSNSDNLYKAIFS